MTYSNRDPILWIRAMADLEHANPGDRFEEDFADVFGEDFPEDDEDDLDERISPQTGFVD